MVQEHYVLKCVACQTFQSQIVKKIKKWECKICSTKQSLMKVYGQGSGKDCRIHTQKLNLLKGEKEIEGVSQSEENDEARSKQHINDHLPGNKEVLRPQKSKWNEYLDEPTPMSDEERHSATEPPNYVHIPDGHPDTKKRKISDVDSDEVYNFELNEFPKSILALKNSLYQSSAQQESIYNSLDLNSYVETSGKNYFSSTKKLKNENLLPANSGKFNVKSELNLEKSNFSGRKNTGPTLFFNQTSSSGYANVDKVNALSEMLLTSNHNRMQGDLHTRITKHGSNDVLHRENAPEKTMTKIPAGSIFEQDCDLSDSEFQLEF